LPGKLLNAPVGARAIAQLQAEPTPLARFDFRAFLSRWGALFAVLDGTDYRARVPDSIDRR
jgi:hypothetical protein